MSTDVVKQIIGHAIAEPEYRELLFMDPGKALEGLDLTEEEVSNLKKITRESFEAVAGELTERVSRAGFTLGTTDNHSEIVKIPGRLKWPSE